MSGGGVKDQRPGEVDSAMPVDAARRADYEAPRLELLGTVEELTLGGGTPTMPDGSSFFGTISDRRLKTDVAPVDGGALLHAVRVALL